MRMQVTLQSLEISIVSEFRSERKRESIQHRKKNLNLSEEQEKKSLKTGERLFFFSFFFLSLFLFSYMGEWSSYHEEGVGVFNSEEIEKHIEAEMKRRQERRGFTQEKLPRLLWIHLLVKHHYHYTYKKKERKINKEK